MNPRMGSLQSSEVGSFELLLTPRSRAIRRNSRRAKGSFGELNCAAIPQDLVESELFAAPQGAHSTATRKIEGKVGAAGRGHPPAPRVQGPNSREIFQE